MMRIYIAAALTAASFLALTSPGFAGERIVNGNQVATVTDRLSDRLDIADIVKGRKVFKRRCRSCHTLGEDEPNKTGPNLWNVVGRKLGSKQNFKYSEDMVTMNTHWGYEELDKFLTKPFKFIPSTRMTFTGVKKDQDRANLIAYLRSNSPVPVPLPSDN